METTNIILIGGGTFVILLGFAAIASPNMSRWINVPGGPKLKGIISLVIGLIMIIIGLTI